MEQAKIDEVYRDMRDMIASLMFPKKRPTKEEIKAQIAKGWMTFHDKIVCLDCKCRMAESLEDCKKNPKCKDCGATFTF